MATDTMQYVSQKTVVALILGSFPFFFWGGPDYYSSRVLKEIWNLGHILFFFLLSIYLFNHPAFTRLTMRRRFLLCATIILLLGASIEIIQLHLSDRTSSLADVLRDVSGFMIASFTGLFKGVKSHFARVVNILCVSAILAASFFPLGTRILDGVHARIAFPGLAGFERTEELKRWEAREVTMSRVSSPVRSGRYALRIDFSTARYAGLSLMHFPHDWRGYEALCFSIYNHGEPFLLHIRVHDELHRQNQEHDNRYNRGVLVESGWNDIRLDMYDILNGPRGRQMNLAAIEGFGLFVMKQRTPRTLYLDDLHLE